MITCLIIDDEPLALDILEDYISKLPFVKLSGRCLRASDAIEIMNNESVNLIFLDINMPDVNGIQWIKSLKSLPAVIFTTAHKEYALEGYDLDVLDYLLKPISYDRFLKAVMKANEYLTLSEQKNNLSNNHQEEYIFVKADYKILKIFLTDILYIEGLKDYVKIYAGTQHPILTLQSLMHFENTLPPKEFIRVHKSYIISLKKIQSITKNIIIIGEKNIPIGDNYKEHFFNTINKNMH